ALEHARHGVVRGELDNVGGREGRQPERVEFDTGAPAIEDLEDLGLVAARIRLYFLGRERRTGDVAPARIADEPREIADEEGHLVPQLLELAHFVEQHRVPEMQDGRRGIEARLHAQVHATLELAHQLGADAPPVRAAGASPYSSSPQLAAAPGLAEARLALSTIDVIVTRNDTLDRIFRRLKLNLADLASLRSLPGLQARLDSLRPGEALRFTHKDGLLFGLERRLSESQTLKVSREPSGLKADVLQNPLELRSRTVRGRIEHSLFEAVAAAGANDQTAVELADIFGWDIDFVLDVRPGDAFVVTYDEIWRDGAYLKDGPVEAAAFVNQGREFRAVRYTAPEGGSHYYTPDGRNLHRAFLRAPVDFTRVSSRFNLARRHPILNRIRAHQGVDYAA